MSKAFGSLFGDGGEDSLQTISQPTAFETLPGFAQRAFRTAVERGEGLAGQTDLFGPGELSRQERLGAAQIEELADAFTPAAFEERLGLFADPFEEQVVQSAISDIQRGTQGTLADIGQAASAAGGFGGTRQAVLESEALREMGRSIGDVSGRLRSQAFNTALTGALQSIGQQAGLSSDLFNIGGTLRAQEQAQAQAPIQSAQFLSGLARGVPVGGGSTTPFQTQASGPSLGGVGKLLGGTGALIGAFSDIRLKENIDRMGDFKGVPVYRFNYIGDSSVYEGVMAQDLLNTEHNDAVSMHESGYLMVDYDQLPVKMRKLS